MNVIVFGATGRLGRLVVNEALDRGHDVTAVVRDAAKAGDFPDRVSIVTGDSTDTDRVARIAVGQVVGISAIGPTVEGSPTTLVDSAQALPEGLSQAGVHRLVVAGGAGSLEVAPGLRLVDAPDFPEGWKGVALAHAAALDNYRSATTDVDWSYISPAALLEPGERTGSYRTGGDQLLTDEHGNSRITMEDFAIALLDEAEHPRHIHRRFTVAH